MKISVIHPTARVSPSEVFPEGWYAAYRQFMETCDHPEDVEYILVVHGSRWCKFLEVSDDKGWISPEIVIAINNGRDSVIDQINEGAKHATGDLLTGSMDDLRAPEHWDTLLKDAFWDEVASRHCGSDDAILVCSSGATPERDRELMICGAITRKRYQRMGHILDPAFESMFADNWYAMQARKDHAEGRTRLIERLDIKFDHQHPSMGKNAMDEVYAMQNSPEAYAEGYKTLRAKMGDTRPTLAICLPGENFSMEVMANTVNLLFHAAQRFQITPHFGYSSNVYACRNYFAARLASLPETDLVLWVDDDNLCTPASFDKLVEVMQSQGGPDVLGAWCWIFDREKGECVASFGNLEPREDGMLNATPADPCRSPGDIVGAAYTGFPAVLHRGNVMKRLGPSPFSAIPIVDGEDVSFCLRCNKNGVTIGVHTGVEIQHLKRSALSPNGATHAC